MGAGDATEGWAWGRGQARRTVWGKALPLTTALARATHHTLSLKGMDDVLSDMREKMHTGFITK